MCHEAAGQICKLGAELLGCPADAVEFDGKEVFESAAPETKKTLSEIAYASQFGHMVPLEATETHTSPLSPPPYMVGAAEVEVDTETGEVKCWNLTPAWTAVRPSTPT